MHEKRWFFSKNSLKKTDFNFELTGLADWFRQTESALSLWPRQK